MLYSVESKEMECLKIGILEVQGAFLEHKNALVKARDNIKLPVQIEILEVRHPSHLNSCLDGMIIPGGESTAISLFLKRNNMVEPLRGWIQDKKHVTWGTCAGMIILAKQTENQKNGGQPTVSTLALNTFISFEELCLQRMVVLCLLRNRSSNRRV